MPATWHSPITWQADQLVTENDLNAQVRDNLEYLKARIDNPVRASIQLDEFGDITTSDILWRPIDANRLSLSLVTYGLPLLVGFSCTVATNTSGDTNVYFDVEMNGVRSAGEDGYYIASLRTSGGLATMIHSVSFVVLLNPSSAGTQLIRPMWRVSSASATITLYTGNTPNYALHPHFWVREI